MGKLVKRSIDILLSGAALVLFAPIFVVLVCVIRRHMGSPVIFSQARGGQHNLPFQLFKFRTMTDERDSSGALLPDSVRLTRLGRWIRARSLDELPQLWNVFRGDMSVVGPRPLLAEYLPLYTVRQRMRHQMRPGITGWAQINGRNAIAWAAKFDLDIWYVENWSLILDLRILCRTFWVALSRSGVNHAGEVTMPKFTG
jgi:lipopolysaccharide/colanic/teichoic acid biosynthesis glycosyltransferase